MHTTIRARPLSHTNLLLGCACLPSLDCDPPPQVWLQRLQAVQAFQTKSDLNKPGKYCIALQYLQILKVLRMLRSTEWKGDWELW